MPAVQELYESELKQQNIAVIGVAQFRTTEQDTLGFVDEHNLSFPNIYDEQAQIAARYGVDGVPAYVFIDTDGYIASTSAGAQGMNVLQNRLAEISTVQ